MVIFAKFNSQIYLIGLFGVKFWLFFQTEIIQIPDCLLTIMIEHLSINV